MRREVLLCDLGSCAEPGSAVNPVRNKDVWNAVPYETDGFPGTLLASLGDGSPENVSFSPALTGWYRIFIGVPKRNDRILLRLTEDPAFVPFGSDRRGLFTGYYDPRYRSNHHYYYNFEEVFWKCADLTGQSVIVSKDASCDAMLSWLRFVPMTGEEIDAFSREASRRDTKRLYCTDDIWNLLSGARTPEDWRAVVQYYEQSDAEWLSLEAIQFRIGRSPDGDPDRPAFPEGSRAGEKCRDGNAPELLKDLISFGHERGLKMCASRRMGCWRMEFPEDQHPLTQEIAIRHPELRCVDRDGTVMTALSYCYPEVREDMISRFVDAAGMGFDAVEMIFSRGVPYVLFEPPFVERFRARYGEDPRDLPLDEERVTALRCEIMTEFVRSLRRRLDEAFPDRRVGIHARGLFSLYENKSVAVDLETWAKEGLIDAIISFPQITREVLPPELFRTDAPGRIDLAKYAEYARVKGHDLIYWNQNFRFHEPIRDSRGVPQGPKTQEERIREFAALERKYGVRFYADLMPRHMPPEEFRDFALELYRYGCERFSLWDTYSRVPNRVQWSMVRRLGHKAELQSFSDGEGEFWRVLPIVTIGGQDVSRYVPSFGG